MTDETATTIPAAPALPPEGQTVAGGAPPTGWRMGDPGGPPTRPGAPTPVPNNDPTTTTPPPSLKV